MRWRYSEVFSLQSDLNQSLSPGSNALYVATHSPQGNSLLGYLKPLTRSVNHLHNFRPLSLLGLETFL